MYQMFPSPPRSVLSSKLKWQSMTKCGGRRRQSSSFLGMQTSPSVQGVMQHVGRILWDVVSGSGRLLVDSGRKYSKFKSLRGESLTFMPSIYSIIPRNIKYYGNYTPLWNCGVGSELECASPSWLGRETDGTKRESTKSERQLSQRERDKFRPWTRVEGEVSKVLFLPMRWVARPDMLKRMHPSYMG